MITRIVKLTIKPVHLHDFLSTYRQSQELIKNFDGCLELRLLQDKSANNIVYTFSKWRSERDLEQYRNSNTFIEIWRSVKPLFAAKAEAWSMQDI